MKTYLLFSALILVIFSCSLEYDSSVTESLDASIPTSRLYNVEHVQVKGGVTKVTFEAEEAVIWDEKEETELMNFVFNEFNGDGEVITTGNADYLLVSDSHDANIKGNIYGYSQNNEASITADNLSWLDEKRELSSADDTPVSISMDNGSLLQGDGFLADLYTNTTSFSTKISGYIESRSSDD